MESLKQLIRQIPDFPKPGILFYDITTLLKDGPGLQKAAEALVIPYQAQAIDKVVGIEARGFIFSAIVAHSLGAGMVTIRKPGKLPGITTVYHYEMEYDKRTLEIHKDAIDPGERVIIIDDIIATGETSRAAIHMIESLGGVVVGLGCLFEITALNGRNNLTGYSVHSVLQG